MTLFNGISGKPARWFAAVSVSNVAFLALLGASANPQDSTERGTNDSEPVEWGLKQNGVRTGLSAGDGEFSLGKPMLFRLVIENLGNRSVRFDSEPVVVDFSMSIERSDGTNVPCIAPHPQTGMGPAVALKSKERTVLFEGLDIADQYLLTSPGTYRVQYTGQDGRSAEFGKVAIPASNTVTIKVVDGPVRPSRLLARTLFDVVQPSGWRVEIDKEGDVVPRGRSSVNGTAMVLIRDGRNKMKGDERRALIWVTASPSAIATPELDEKGRGPAAAIGRCSWGEVYLWSAVASPEELTTIRKLTTAALKIDER